MWDLPGPGLEPVSPALAGGFLTTVPLGKLSCTFKISFYYLLASIDFVDKSMIFLTVISLEP